MRRQCKGHVKIRRVLAPWKGAKGISTHPLRKLRQTVHLFIDCWSQARWDQALHGMKAV